MTITTLQTFQSLLAQAIQNDSLITFKHSPYTGHLVVDRFHSVVNHDVANDPQQFLNFSQFEMYHFHNTDPRHGTFYMEMRPTGQTITGSGVTFGTITRDLMDTYVVVPFANGNLHVYAETQRQLAMKIDRRDLLPLPPLQISPPSY